MTHVLCQISVMTSDLSQVNTYHNYNIHSCCTCELTCKVLSGYVTSYLVNRSCYIQLCTHVFSSHTVLSDIQLLESVLLILMSENLLNSMKCLHSQ